MPSKTEESLAGNYLAPKSIEKTAEKERKVENNGKKLKNGKVGWNCDEARQRGDHAVVEKENQFWDKIQGSK